MGGSLIVAAVSAGLLLSGLTVPAAAMSAASSEARVRGALKAEPSPAVFLDTNAAQGGKRGILIEDPNAAGGKGLFVESPTKTWLTVAALDRSDLSVIYTKNYSCPQVVGQTRYDAGEKAAAPCIAAVQNDLKPLTSKALVIATNVGAGNDQAPYGAVKALKGIGVQPVWWWGAGSSLTPGTFSAVGSPGSSAGEASQASGNGASPDTAAIRTLLARNNRGFYDVMANDRVSFVTDARASNATRHVVRINGDPYGVQVDGGGYHVVWFNRGAATPDTLNVGQEFFATQDKGLDELRRMKSKIDEINGYELMGLVVSVGQPLPKNMMYANALAIRDLVDSLQAMGATRNGAFGPLDRRTAKGQSYVLIGDGDGPGIESTHVAVARSPGRAASAALSGEVRRTKVLPRRLTAGENNAGIAGLMSRDELWRYEPTVTVDGDTDPELPAVSVIYQKPTAWPKADDPQFSAALSDLGQMANLGANPRARYWTQAYSPEYWSNRLDDVRTAKYKQTDQYPAKVFDDAQDQLVKEIKWVRETYGYYAVMAKPYEAIGLQTWAKMTAVADSIDRNVDVPNARKVAGSVLTIVQAAAEIVGEFPKVGTPVSATMAVFNLAVEVTELASGESAADDYRVAVSDLGQKTADRLTEATSSVGTTFPQIVVSDYAKLKRVGQCAGTSEACDDADDWQMTSQGLKASGDQFRDNMSVMFYQSLLPAKYQVFNLNASPRTRANSAICAVSFKDVFNGFKPWTDATARVSTPVRLFASEDSSDAGLFTVFALGATTSDKELFNELSYPTAQALDPIFGSGDNQLGADPETFIRRSWTDWVPGNKYECHWDKNVAGVKDVYEQPAVKEGLGHGLFRDVKARLLNDTGRTIWVAKYLEREDKRNWQKLPDGKTFDVDSDAWLPTMVRVGVTFTDPATTDWQDELQFVNPPAENPFVWHSNSDTWSRKWSLEPLQARGSSGWKDDSYQSDGYPYTLYMKRDSDSYHYVWFTATFTLRGRSPLSPPGPPWGND